MANESKTKQLGMPFGTAQNRLRKLVLFGLLKKHEENVCYRCGKFIETVEELSMDHKSPWLGISNELFWDTTNIAFSHISCNSAAGRRSVELGNKGNKFIISPPGLSWCTSCKEHKPIKEFWKAAGVRARLNGLRDECKECSNARHKSK